MATFLTKEELIFISWAKSKSNPGTACTELRYRAGVDDTVEEGEERFEMRHVVAALSDWQVGQTSPRMAKHRA